MTPAQMQKQTFYNKIKILLIPLILINNSFVTEFKLISANLFDHFAAHGHDKISIRIHKL